jgi:hypothetical protein
VLGGGIASRKELMMPPVMPRNPTSAEKKIVRSILLVVLSIDSAERVSSLPIKRSLREHTLLLFTMVSPSANIGASYFNSYLVGETSFSMRSPSSAHDFYSLQEYMLTVSLFLS